MLVNRYSLYRPLMEVMVPSAATNRKPLGTGWTVIIEWVDHERGLFTPVPAIFCPHRGMARFPDFAVLVLALGTALGGIYTKLVWSGEGLLRNEDVIESCANIKMTVYAGGIGWRLDSTVKFLKKYLACWWDSVSLEEANSASVGHMMALVF